MTGTIDYKTGAASITFMVRYASLLINRQFEITLDTSFKVDAQDAYLHAMADGLRKSMDMAAFKLASRQAHANCGTNPVTFSILGAIVEAETDRIQVISRYIDRVDMVTVMAGRHGHGRWSWW